MTAEQHPVLANAAPLVTVYCISKINIKKPSHKMAQFVTIWRICD